MTLSFTNAIVTGAVQSGTKKIFYPGFKVSSLVYTGIEGSLSNLISQIIHGAISMPDIISTLRRQGQLDVLGSVIAASMQTFIHERPGLDLSSFRRFLINMLLYLGSNGVANAVTRPSVINSAIATIASPLNMIQSGNMGYTPMNLPSLEKPSNGGFTPAPKIGYI